MKIAHIAELTLVEKPLKKKKIYCKKLIRNKKKKNSNNKRNNKALTKQQLLSNDNVQWLNNENHKQLVNLLCKLMKINN